MRSERPAPPSASVRADIHYYTTMVESRPEDRPPLRPHGAAFRGGGSSSLPRPVPGREGWRAVEARHGPARPQRMQPVYAAGLVRVEVLVRDLQIAERRIN